MARQVWARVQRRLRVFWLVILVEPTGWLELGQLGGSCLFSLPWFAGWLAPALAPAGLLTYPALLCAAVGGAHLVGGLWNYQTIGGGVRARFAVAAGLGLCNLFCFQLLWPLGALSFGTLVYGALLLGDGLWMYRLGRPG